MRSLTLVALLVIAYCVIDSASAAYSLGYKSKKSDDMMYGKKTMGYSQDKTRTHDVKANADGSDIDDQDNDVTKYDTDDDEYSDKKRDSLYYRKSDRNYPKKQYKAPAPKKYGAAPAAAPAPTAAAPAKPAAAPAAKPKYNFPALPAYGQMDGGEEDVIVQNVNKNDNANSGSTKNENSAKNDNANSDSIANKRSRLNYRQSDRTLRKNKRQ
jgi:hypothetical protein